MELFVNKIEIVNKYVISYGDELYMTKGLFTFSHYDWATRNLEEVPENMLFDTYEQAEDTLLWMSNFHKLTVEHMKVKPVRILVKRDLLERNVCDENFR